MTTVYDVRESQIFRQQLDAPKGLSTPDKRANYQEFLQDAQNSPQIVAQRAGWLLCGNYGQGSYTAAQDVLRRPRMNRRAWLFVTIASLEWGVSNYYARKAWHALSADQQARVNELLDAEIADASAE